MFNYKERCKWFFDFYVEEESFKVFNPSKVIYDIKIVVLEEPFRDPDNRPAAFLLKYFHDGVEIEYYERNTTYEGEYGKFYDIIVRVDRKLICDKQFIKL